jgi:hypothetical protein
MSAMSDTQKDPSEALLTPSGVPGNLSMSTSLLPALGCGGKYSLQAAVAHKLIQVHLSYCSS